ncbi:MAG: dTDP-4-dehydrorhamnose reductase [Flavobacteriaceae bacterium]|jgi:dTDP-4-dehydrorhamnose reductase|nr:dTDP-4-dehydrorhamnose reductase [Flavobacteriaceae bacterium]
MINVLVTGSNGQLASCIKDRAKQHKGLHFIYTDYQELDIRNLNDVEEFFKTHPKIDYCINCAAYTAVDKAETEVEKAFEINAQGSKNLALVCNAQDTILIHVSTDFVFDGNRSEPYTETDTPNPISVYGASKLKGEVEIQKTLKKHFIIRTSWLYSEHGTNFMKTMLRLAETRDEINVVSDQIGTPTYAGDLAKMILNIVSSKNTNFGLYHYSNEGMVSWYDFAKAIFELSDIEIKLNPIKTVDHPTPAKRPKYSTLDTKKVYDFFSVKPPSFKQSLKRLIKSL